MTTGVIVLFHGSRSAGAAQAAQRICDDAAAQGAFGAALPAYLRHVQPDLPEAVHDILRRGADRIVIVPCFALPGGHVEAELSALVEDLRRRHPRREIRVTDIAGSHPLMTEIVIDLVKRQV